MDILSSLRNTSKGRLEYDGYWYKDGALEEVLSECTSSPSIPSPPQSRTAETAPDRSLPVTGLTLTPAEHTAYKKKINSFKGEEEQRETDLKTINCSLPSSMKERKNSLNRSHQGRNKSSRNDISHNTTHNKSLDKSLEDKYLDRSHDSSQSWSLDVLSLSETDGSLVVNNCGVLAEDCGEQLDELTEQGSETGELLMPTVTDVDHALRDHDHNLQTMIRCSLDGRRALFAQASATFGLEAESALTAVYVKQEHEAQRVLAAALAEQRAQSVEAQRYELQCREKAKQHAAFMDSKLREAQARKKQQEEEEENQRRQEIADQLETLSKVHEELKVMCTSSVKAITSCPFPQHLSDNTKKASQILVQIIQRLDVLKQACAAGPSNQHIIDALELTKKARGCADIIEKGVDAANKQGKAEAEAMAKTAAAKAAAAAAASADKTVTVASDEVMCVDEQRFIHYQKLQDQLKTIKDSYIQLTTDANLKKYRFDLQKAVNTPVNAIAPTSGTHLRDKLTRLCAILQGSQVEVGGKRVSATEHPAGKAFVKDLFAAKIIKQGEQQVASNHESAFAIAAVAVGMWGEVPEVGDLILAHFHRACPYTVPYYIPKKEGQTSEEYYKSLGYLYVDGEVESRDKYLQRMSGIMRLYSSIMVATPPRSNVQHPHGVQQAWLWVTSTLNLEPRPDITATMLFDLLTVTGHALFSAYKAQFVKLLQLLCTEYLPKVKAVTPAGSGGPVGRLESFLQKCIASSSVPKPDGLLSANFWYT